MEIREISNKDALEGFLNDCTEKTFLQSWNWGEFNLTQKNKIWRLGVYNNGKLICVVSVYKISARRGTFLFIPHGPMFQEDLIISDKKEILQLILTHLSSIAKEENASFVRISPLLENSEKNQNIFKDLGFILSPMHSSAYEATWKLDLNLPEEELLQNMRKTTRYLIKKASENTDISIEISYNSDDIEIYQKLNRQVAKRQKFVPFSDNFIKSEFQAFNKDNQVIFIFGKYKGELACGAMIIFWSGMGFYHQAASLEKFSKFSIPYLLQWEAIKEAKKRGYLVYDFWGFTDPEKFPKHPWAGPTLFKMGFGGYKKEYIKTQDFVISKKYWINYIIEKVRKFRRGL